MASDRWSGPWDFPASRPIAVDNGLATRKKRGAMAGTWWSQRFVDALESFGLGGRMERGRRYARKGQVVSITIEPGTMRSSVQGSRSRPYDVTVTVPVPTDAQWEALIDVMAERVGFVARLLAGEVPAELEAAFDDVGVALFPASWRSVGAYCSCPDDGDPCKHIAAALYVFADQLDDDPWLLLAWMGRTREALLAPMRAGADATRAERDPHGLPPWWPLQPGRDEPHGTAVLDEVLTTAAEPADSVLTRLDALDLAVRDEPVRELLRPAYEAVAATEDGPDVDP